jgi:hypothetical protein
MSTDHSPAVHPDAAVRPPAVPSVADVSTPVAVRALRKAYPGTVASG